MQLSRRDLLVAAAALVGSRPAVAREAQGPPGLEAFGGSEPPCGPEGTLTPALAPDGTFRAGAPERASLTEPGFAGARIVVTGTVAGVTCGRIKDARVDFWQAKADGRYDPSGFALRGHQLTDAAGRYRLVTPMPGAPAGRAPHISIRIAIAGKPDFWTEAFLPGEPRNARDSRFRPELAMKKTPDGYLFDVLLKM